MKRFLGCFLVATLLLSCVGCGDVSPAAPEADTTTATVVSDTETQPTTTTTAPRFYRATGTGGTMSTARYLDEYVAEMKLDGNRIRGLADTALQDTVNTRLARMLRELNAESEAYSQWLAAQSSHSEPDRTPQIVVECHNGYLSLLAIWQQYKNNDDFFYDCRTAVFDLYTGRELSLSDLFADGSDFITPLNTYIRSYIRAYEELTEEYKLKREFVGVPGNMATFTTTKIYFPTGDPCFVRGTSFGLCLPLHDVLLSGAPRDMAGLFDETVKVTRRIVTVEGEQTNLWKPSRYDPPQFSDPFNISFNSLTMMDPAYGNRTLCNKINEQMQRFTEDCLSDAGMRRSLAMCGTVAKGRVGPYSFDDSYTLLGNRAVMFRGSYSITPLEGESEHTILQKDGSPLENDGLCIVHFNFLKLFDATSGEEISFTALLRDGWQQSAVWSQQNQQLSGAPALETLQLMDISQNADGSVSFNFQAGIYQQFLILTVPESAINW